MHIAIARFPAVAVEQNEDFREWFAASNDQLRDKAGLQCCADGGAWGPSV